MVKLLPFGENYILSLSQTVANFKLSPLGENYISQPPIVLKRNKPMLPNIRLAISGGLNKPNFESESSKRSLSLSYEHIKGKLEFESSQNMRRGAEFGHYDSLPSTTGGEDNGGKKFSGGGSGGGNGGSDGDELNVDDEFGPIITIEEAIKEAEKQKVTLPHDLIEAIKGNSVRKLLFTRYMKLQVSYWPLSFLTKYCALVRNRMLLDDGFLFKVGVEVLSNFCCATIAQIIRKRGNDFWADNEWYTTNLLVGVVVDVALVSILAPYARIGTPYPIGHSGVGNFVAALPSSFFEFASPGCSFSLLQRTAAYLYTGVLFCSVGTGCSVVGQGIAHMLVTAKRSLRKPEDDLHAPLLRNSLLFGAFLMVSSNTRYQALNALDFMMQALPVARQVPLVTAGVRVANNVYGRMQYGKWLEAVEYNAKREGNDTKKNHTLV